MLVRAIYNSSAPTLSNKQPQELQLDVNGNLKIAGSVASSSTSMQARGTEDVAGADTYTTLITPSANATHAFITLGGTNDAIISFDGGSTEGPVIPAGTAVVFDGLTITSGVAIQGKNKTAGQNYANLNVSIW